jgi:uncharacterized protein (TIGR00251 family)
LRGDASGLDIRRSEGGVTLWIHVSPRARRESVAGTHGDALRVAVQAPPVEGAANEACRRALARALGVGRAAVELDPAAKGRRKRVRVHGDPEAIALRVRELAGMLAGPATSD